jgi:hypothetical protein
MRDFDPNRNPYQILGVRPSATPEQVREAYHRLALRYHPDRNPSPDALHQMQEINWAYHVLRDPFRRADYDAMYASARPSQAYSAPRSSYAPPPDQSTYRKPTASAVNPPPFRPMRSIANGFGISGFTVVIAVWLVIRVIGSAMQLNRPSNSFDPSLAPVMWTAEAKNYDYLYLPLTATARASQGLPAVGETFADGSSIPPTMTPSGFWVDILDQVKPGTSEWLLIDTFFSDYHLTTPGGLSDEVIRVQRNTLTNDLAIENRHYGTFHIYWSSEGTPVSLHIPPVGQATETPLVTATPGP